MSIADQLKTLDELRQSGALSQDEFEIAKRKLLDGNEESASEQHLSEIKQQNEIAQLDREWQIERDNYMVTGKHGVRRLPSRAGSVVGGIFVTGFGIFWTMMAGSATRMSSNSHGVGSVFPLFGILFVIFGVCLSIYMFVRASQYEAAEESYRRRRQQLTGSINES